MATERSLETPEPGTWFKKMTVTLVCLCGAGYSSYLLYQDITSRGVRVGTPMGKLERTESHVRLKPNNSFIWANAGSNEDLYRKDSIQTAPASAAAVRFKDGSLLEVGENSLIVIDNMSDLALNFVHGSAVLRTSTGDSKITVDEAGKTKIEKLPARLLKPEPVSESFVSEDAIKVVLFAWELTPKPGQEVPAKVTLQVSPDRHFKSKETLSFELAGTDKETTVPLPAGHYYWRLLAGNETLGEPSRFRIDSIVALKPLYPTLGQKIPVFGDTAEIPFRWTPATEESGAGRLSHKIEVSKSVDFQTIVARASVTSTSGLANMKDLPDGILYWRMISSADDASVKSAVQKFDLQKLQKAEIELSQPEQKASLQLQPQTSFSWNTDSSDVDYRWQIRKAGSEKVESESPFLHGKTFQLSSSKDGVVAGHYEWRVQAFMKEHVVGESVWRDVNFYEGAQTALQFPAAHQEFHFWNETPEFVMKWSPDEKVEAGKGFYQVEIANDPEFKSAERIETRTASLSSSQVKWNAGPQFWRVGVLGSAKETLKVSSSSDFFYGPYPTLRAPASVKPESGTVYNALEQTKSFVVNWDAVENAQGYELTVKLNGKLDAKADGKSEPDSKVIYKQVIQETQHEFKDLKPGKYTYSVLAIDRLKRPGEATQAHQFEVTYGDVLGAPESVSPEVQ